LLIAHMIMGAIRCGSGFPIATPTCQSCVQSSDSYPDKTQVGLPDCHQFAITRFEFCKERG